VTTLPSDGTITVVLDAGGGNDNINLSAPNLAAATINAEDGDDVIVGSGAVDAISGGLGNDRITGFRGNETIHGDDGNDVMIWNNGDGNDTNEGDGGVDETLITEGNADDENTVTPSGAGFRFDRVSPAPINVISNNVEKLSLTSFSGNDKLTTAPGVSVPMNIDAGTGDDTIVTGDGADLIAGNDGNDTLSGGAADDTLVWNNGDGSDAMNGDDGIDRIETNLSAAADTSTLKLENGRVRYDRTNPGPFNLSTDTVVADAQTIDAVAADVESVDRPAITVPGKAAVAKKAKVKKGVATLKVSCPAGASGCNGAVTLLSTKSLKAGRVKAQLVLGRKTYALKAGETKSIKVKLASGTAKLAKKKKLVVSARVVSQGADERASKITLAF
jgi:Ca2+-binding RTX toxin-like protein